MSVRSCAQTSHRRGRTMCPRVHRPPERALRLTRCAPLPGQLVTRRVSQQPSTAKHARLPSFPRPPVKQTAAKRCCPIAIVSGS